LPVLVFSSAGRAVAVADPRMTVLDVAIAEKIPHFRECGGHGRCTTCRVRIIDGMQNVLPRTPCEAGVAATLGWDSSTRLACQTRVSGDVSLEPLIRSCADVSRMQVEEATAAPQEETLAVLFCDIRDFTPFVEKHLAYDVLHILNRFFKAVGDPILMNNGVIYQYVGDQIVGLFGLGGDAADKSCLDALRAGFGMLGALDQLNTELSNEFDMTLDIGIGAHCGALVAGMIGHPNHRQFAVIGDAMNIASRIEGANKMFGGAGRQTTQERTAQLAALMPRFLISSPQRWFSLAISASKAAPSSAMISASMASSLARVSGRASVCMNCSVR
jgi:class 3 adenylate cyclase